MDDEISRHDGSAHVARKTTQEKLREAEDRMRSAENRLRALKQAAKREDARLANKRKIIVGGWLMANRPDLVQQVVKLLKRDQDRAAFVGWQPPPVATSGLGAQSANRSQ